jgi:hypothetical protein
VELHTTRRNVVSMVKGKKPRKRKPLGFEDDELVEPVRIGHLRAYGHVICSNILGYVAYVILANAVAAGVSFAVIGMIVPLTQFAQLIVSVYVMVLLLFYVLLFFKSQHHIRESRRLVRRMGDI